MANTGYSSASCMFLQYPAVATDYNPKYMYGKKSGHYFFMKQKTYNENMFRIKGSRILTVALTDRPNN